jgi:hypothetical protein
VMAFLNGVNQVSSACSARAKRKQATHGQDELGRVKRRRRRRTSRTDRPKEKLTTHRRRSQQATLCLPRRYNAVPHGRSSSDVDVCTTGRAAVRLLEADDVRWRGGQRLERVETGSVVLFSSELRGAFGAGGSDRATVSVLGDDSYQRGEEQQARRNSHHRNPRPC